MPFDIKILADKIEGIKQAFENGKFADAMLHALENGRGVMKQRIFRETVDVAGQSFGEYIGRKSKVSEAKVKEQIGKTKSAVTRKRIRSSAVVDLTYWQRKRALLGKQTAKKDLFYTGGLSDSIETQVEDEKAVVLQFSTAEYAAIAKGQELQITNIRDERKANAVNGDVFKIFRLNTDEREKVNEQGLLLIKQILKP